MIIEICFFSAALLGGSIFYKKIEKLPAKFKKRDHGSQPEEKESGLSIPTFTLDEQQPDRYASTVNQNLALAVAAIGLSMTGAFVFVPLITFSSVIILLYLILFVFNKAVKAVFKERRMAIEILDFVLQAGLLIAGMIPISAVCVFGYYLYRKLRLMAEHKARKSFSDMLKKEANSVWLIKEGMEIEVPVESVNKGDVVAVRAGETIYVDGIITRGVASIDEHVMTGESRPAQKGEGERVFAATIVISGDIHISVEKAGRESDAERIAAIIENTRDFTSHVESIGQQLADHSVLPISCLGILSLPIVGLQGSVAILFSNFLGTMRLTAPMVMLNSLSRAAQRDVFIKDGRSLMLMKEMDTVIFDKTGTLTQNRFDISNIYAFHDMGEDEVLRYAAAAEYRQKHPAAPAICEKAAAENLSVPKIDSADYNAGYGIIAKIDGKSIKVGSERFMDMENVEIPDGFGKLRKKIHDRGFFLTCVAENNRLIGAVEMHPTIREEAKAVVRELKRRNISVMIISGDHEKPTRALAEQLGIDDWFSEILADKKGEFVEKLQQAGRTVCFVGDGINDSIALKKADVSISVNGASTIAEDVAQIVLMDGTLKNMPRLFDVAEAFQKNMNRTFMATTYPGVLAIGGVFFAGFTLMQAFIAYMISSAAGIGTALLPYPDEGEE